MAAKILRPDGPVAVAGGGRIGGVCGGDSAAVLLRSVLTWYVVVRGLQDGHEPGGTAGRQRILRMMTRQAAIHFVRTHYFYYYGLRR